MAGCVCSRVRSAPTVSASLDQPTIPDRHSSCSHSQQTACRHSFSKNPFLFFLSKFNALTPTYLCLLILRIILPIDLARRSLVRRAKRGIPDLRWEVVFEIEETRLAYVARLCAGLTDNRRFESHACARVPAEDGEWTSAGPAFTSKFLF